MLNLLLIRNIYICCFYLIFIKYSNLRWYFMKYDIILDIQYQMKPYLNQTQYINLTRVLKDVFVNVEVSGKISGIEELSNNDLLDSFISAKLIEGCSTKTIKYYESTLMKMLEYVDKRVDEITTDDLRGYLSDYKNCGNLSKTTVDNIRRIFSSFFSWLENEDYILKNPVKRIHRIKTPRLVKETLSDEELERLCSSCDNVRDLAILELLISTGMRVGELVKLDIVDINFHERECVVFGKGESERIVYFDARCKLHLLQYLSTRDDDNPALFVSFNRPYNRLGINGVELRLKKLGEKSDISNVHPHKFRRTLATNAIDKGMPIEQVQKLLGHMQIDTTMRYAMVNQSNVKYSHRKFIG